eukprot:g4148.t1
MTDVPPLRIRAVTCFCSLTEDNDLDEIQTAAEFCQRAKHKLEETGLEIQECRIGANCFLDFSLPVEALVSRIKTLDQKLTDVNLILNLGPTEDPTALEKFIPLLEATKNIYFHFALSSSAQWDLMRKCAKTILQIATKLGVDGSFRFCVSSQCPPFIPYFPASYTLNKSPLCFAIGVENSGVLHQLPDCQMSLQKLEMELRNRLTELLQPVEKTCQEIAELTGRKYLHIDCSLCPRLEEPPMTSLWSKFGIGLFGQSGTLALCSAITKALKSIDVQLGGFSGLMLPVCEDAGLVDAANQGLISVSDLLHYSTVCACGLDCVPVAGYSGDSVKDQYIETRIAAHLMDLHSISTNKLGIRIKSRSATETGVGHTTRVDESQDVHEPHYVGKKALIVGAGPAGSLAASYLSKQGFTVEVYEKRKDPLESDFVPSRSITMVLNNSTANVLRVAGLNIVNKDDQQSSYIRPFLGGALLNSSGGLTPPSKRQNASFLTQRHDLAKSIISTVRKTTLNKINFNFEHSCIGVDLKTKEVSFQYKDDNTVKRDYDLLVGADGSNSEIRKGMEDQIRNFTVSALSHLLLYKSIQNITVNEKTVPEKYKQMTQPGVVTFYRDVKKFGNEEGLKAMSFTRSSDGNLVGGISASQTGFKSTKGKEKDCLNSTMPEDFPQDWIDQMIPQLRDNPAYRVPSVVEVSTLIGPNVVLIGDAGHSVSPGMGMGCNMAIQDTQVLNDALASAKGDINQALKNYNDIRHEEVARIQLLEKIISAEYYEQEGIKKLLPLASKCHLTFHTIGHGYLPWLIPLPAFFRCMNEEISSKEAIRFLQLELVVFSVVTASTISIFFKALLGVF